MKTMGVTLTECLLVLLIMGILATLSLPLWQRKTLGLTHQANLLRAHLQLADSLALSHHQLVTLCGSSDAKQCDGKWAMGYLLFFGEQPSQHLLIQYQRLPQDIQLSWRGFRSKKQVQFNPSDFLNAHNGTFTLVQNNTQESIKLIINNAGRIRETHHFQ